MFVKVFVNSIYYNYCHEFRLHKDSPVQSCKNLISEEIKVSTSFFRLQADLYNFEVILTETFPIDFYFPDSDIVLLKIVLINLGTSLTYSKLIEATNNNNLKAFSTALSESTTKHIISIPGLTNNFTLLHLAASLGHTKIMKKILKHDPDLINQQSTDGWSALMLSCAFSHIDSCKFLINQSNINLNLTTKKGSALHLAVKSGSKEIVNHLLMIGALVTCQNSDGKKPHELDCDKEILELLMRFLRVQELISIEGIWKNSQTKAFAYNSGIFKDKQVVLRVSQAGIFEEYDEKNYKMPNFFLPIVHISKVTDYAKRVSRSKFFLQVIGENVQKIYYFKCREQRDLWVDQLNSCIAAEEGRRKLKSEIFKIQDPYENFNREQDLWSENLTLADFERINELGLGSFGSVYKIIKKSTGEEFAMKCLSKQKLLRNKMLGYAEKEIEIMKDLNHPFILKLFYSISTENVTYLILEYCKKGDLGQILEVKNLTELEAKFYLAEIILGLEYLHNKGIVYRDLKPDNVLIGQDGHIRLADFGLAKEIGQDQIFSTFAGSPAYISPEILERKKITKTVDIYSLGIVMHELLTGKLPFDDQNIEDVFDAVRLRKFRFDKSLGKEALSLINALTSKNPEKRPGYNKIKNHAFFNGIDWISMINKRYEPPGN